MSKNYINTIIGIAFILMILAIVIAFVDLKQIHIKETNDGYVSGIFSLVGILLYFTALMYQIKEYKLQVDELKKSVLAQTKSSEALDEQKRILIEQNINSLIFGMIQHFNDFKQRNETQVVIDDLVNFYQGTFALQWKNNLDLRLNKSELNEKFAMDIKGIFSRTISKHKSFSIFHRYIQFIYNILYIIDQNKSNLSKDYFTPLFHSQLNVNETVILYLSNLVDIGMPFYDNLHWSYNTSEEIVNTIINYNEINIDFSEIDIEVLTKQFQELKQH